MRAVLALAVLFMLAGPAAGQDLQLYEDDRFGTTAMVPEDWRRMPDDSRWQGTRFTSPNGEAWVAVWGIRRTASSPREYMRLISDIPGERITYQRRGKGWIVVSGFKGDRIFYRKALLACGGSVWHNLAFEYPAEKKRAFDRLVTRASRSLQAGDCG